LYCNKVYQQMQLFFLCTYFLFYPICFGLSWAHHQGYPKLFFIYNHLVHAVFMLLICVCLQAHADEQHKHHMNQMVVYKKQLGIPLMMGSWETETCRVKKEISTQNKELHLLVNLIAIQLVYVGFFICLSEWLHVSAPTCSHTATCSHSDKQLKNQHILVVFWLYAVCWLHYIYVLCVALRRNSTFCLIHL